MRAGETHRFNGWHKKGCGAKFSVLATYSWDPSRKTEGRTVEGQWVPGKCADFWRATDGAEYASGSFGLMYVCACGRHLYARPVLGRYNAGKKCDGRCLSATGHSCECAGEEAA